MDSSLLKTFLLLVQTKNFTKAAARLHRSQSAISLQISRLEKLIGRPLLNRDNKNVSLTLYGEEFLGYAKEMVRLEEELFDRFQRSSVLNGNVTFGTPEDLATMYLSKILANFVSTYPSVLLNVQCEFTEYLLDGFHAHKYDIVLIKQDPDKALSRSEEVWKEPLVWACSEDFQDQNMPTPLPLVLSPSPCVYRQRAVDTLDHEGIRWRIVYTSPSLTGTLAAVKAGLGVTILPLKMVPAGVRILKTLPPLKDAQIALLVQEGASDAVRALAEYVTSHIIAG